MKQDYFRMTREKWEAEYVRGQWDYVKQLDELAHYSVILGYCCYFRPGGTILDIGCGEGILQERLSPCQYSRYVGIDICAEAIHRALPKQDEKTFFIRADASTYNPEERFDIIVFNECLYYFEDSLSTLRRYERFLNQDGIFVASMHVTEMTMDIWKVLEAVYLTKDGVTVSNQSGGAWIIKIFTLQ